jgi:hypothetical protein
MQRNKIADLSLTGNLSVEQAHRALNPVDTETLKQQAIDEYHRQQSQKAAATPSTSPQAAPAATGTGHAKSIHEAFAQAKSELGIN